MSLLVPLLLGFSLEWPSDGSGFCSLPDSIWVVPGTAMAVIGEDTVGVLVEARGSRLGLVLPEAAENGTLVTFVFDRAPLSVASFRRLDLRPLETEPVDLDSILPLGFSGSEQGPPGLYISGQKRLGISLGDDGGLDQALRLSISGNLAPDVRVSGELTDENLPLGSGSSELLSELDRVSLGLYGPDYHARLGDMDWSRDGPAPLSWDREVSGIEAGLETGAMGLSGGYAIAGDRTGSAVFHTSEGVQGPYDLVPSGGIAPGSEIVYLDGALLSRGVTRDYTMDYSAGAITFTPARLIRREQRVEAYFARQTDGYRRDLFTGDVCWNAGEGLRIGAAGLSESDDTGDPIGFSLDEEALQALEAAGGESDSAYVFGGELVGDGEGSYDLDSLGHFLYVGPGNGSWRVFFSRPPEAPGDYVYDSFTGGYSWAGEEQGTHLPRRYLALPESHEAAAFLLGLDAGALNLETEAAVSRRSDNILASDITTRSGTCVRSSARLTPFGDSGPVVSAVLQIGTDGFRSPGRLEADSSLASWALPAGYSSADDIAEAAIVSRFLTGSAGWRSLSSGGRLSRARTSLELSPGPAGLRLLGSINERSETMSMAAGSRTRGAAAVDYCLGRLTPRASFTLQRDAWADSLEGYVSVAGVGLSSSSGRGLAGDLSIELETDGRSGDGQPRPERTLRAAMEASASAQGVGAGSASFEHSESFYPGGGSVSADAISVRCSTSGSLGWAQMIYSGSGVLAREIEVRYRYVGEGEGDYSYDEGTGTWYPDPDGDYEKYYASGEEGDLVVQASLDLNLSANLSSSSGVDAGIGLANSGDSGRLRTLLLLDALRNRESGTASRSVSLSPWVQWNEGLLRRLGGRAEIWFETAAYAGAGRRYRQGWRLEVGPVARPAPTLRLEASAAVSRETEDFYEPRDLRGVRLELDPSYLPDGSLELGSLLGWETRRDDGLDLAADMYELMPHGLLRGGGWSFNGQFGLSYIVSGTGSNDLPAWFFDLADAGLSLRPYLRVGRRMGSGLEISAFYSGRQLAGSDWTHNGGLTGTLSF
ncbi:hypothetical protein JW921_00385 [Candidatus Fermentibacterales bacterium]|nr:hypothetical protein [Candidatus Fermentibacterales bacterium]